MQDDVIAFLSSTAGHPAGGPVDVVQTHCAMIFLAGDIALKIKRAVKYDYIDLSTLDRREAMIRRELALNQPVAPQIYNDVIAVTRAPDGRLALDGDGAPVEWVLRMWRFPAKDELSKIADQGKFDDPLAQDLGQGIFAYHAKMPLCDVDGATLISDILAELDREFAHLTDLLKPAQIAQFHDKSRMAFAHITPLLRNRSTNGHVRRCHGDLHLRNLVLLDGKPVPFDALEFDDVLGTCDVLYDLAFLLMDLRHRNLGRAANIVLSAYLLSASGREDDGLATLPLFMSVRAAIRAMVLAQTAHATGAVVTADAGTYLADAVAMLSPPETVVVLVGGLSGSGKTTIAREIAGQIGAIPGAIHLRSDTERKAMIGAAPQSRLDVLDYTPAARAAVYDRVIERAVDIVNTGHSVLIDATFLDAKDRDRASEIADQAKVALYRFWLDAPADVLIDRVTSRRGDASDADADVVRKQLAAETPPDDWVKVDATGAVSDTAGKILAYLRKHQKNQAPTK